MLRGLWTLPGFGMCKSCRCRISAGERYVDDLKNVFHETCYEGYGQDWQAE